MIEHIQIEAKTLHQKIKKGNIVFGGNRKLKIYGTLQCKSGKIMKRKNRVFFNTLEEAQNLGYRPCGHCLKTDYKKWKNGLI